MVARMAAAASNGAILCLHDGRELRARSPMSRATVEAVRRLVPIAAGPGDTNLKRLADYYVRRIDPARAEGDRHLQAHSRSRP